MGAAKLDSHVEDALFGTRGITRYEKVSNPEYPPKYGSHTFRKMYLLDTIAVQRRRHMISKSYARASEA